MDDMLIWVVIGLAVFLFILPMLIGLMISPTQTATRVELIKAPIDATWEALSDLSRQTEWRTDLKSIQLKDDDDGMRWVETSARYGKLVLRKQKEVPQKEIVVQVEKGERVIGTRKAALSAVPGGTRITFTETSDIKSPILRLRSQLRGGIDRQLQTYIEQFKARFNR